MGRLNILISTSPDGGANYEDAVRQSGGDPTAAYCPVWDHRYDGLILAGGDDMDPSYFGQEDRGSGGIDRDRDRAELSLVAACLAAGKPILGICRGHQVLNVALGGTLIQNLSPEEALFHRHQGQDKVHPIRTAPGSLLHRLYGPLLAVNSSHHQVVDALGDGLFPTAWSESGLVEGLEHRKAPVLGVQFHPERMSYARRRPDTADGSVLFNWFLHRCSSGETVPIKGL